MYSSQDLSPGFLIPSSSYLPHFNNNPLLPATQFSINDALQNSFSSTFAPPTPTANQSSVSSVTSPETAAFRKNHALCFEPEVHALFSGSVLNKKNNNPTILGDLVHHDWEAVRYFLSSQVRPGGDVSRIYKCSVCRHEFPNAQAYGGHMSSHSKSNKKRPQIMKKTKRPKKVPLDSYSGNGIKRLKAMDMDSVKAGRIVAEEAVNGEIEQGDGDDDEDWFKYLNCDAVY